MCDRPRELAPWYVRAWEWLKENWKAVLLGVSTLGLGLLVGRSARRPQKVVAPELVGAEEERRRQREEADQKVREAKRLRQEEVSRLEEKHAELLARLSGEQRERVDELKDDPEGLNDFLLQVGRDTRE